LKTIRALISAEQLKKRSTPSNFRLGQEIADAGQIEFLELSPSHIKAKAGTPQGQNRTVEFSLNGDALEWQCSCTSKRDQFCKHAVAVGLASKGKRLKDA
jgi:uncharacterized Zn finger protein